MERNTEASLFFYCDDDGDDGGGGESSMMRVEEVDVSVRRPALLPVRRQLSSLHYQIEQVARTRMILRMTFYTSSCFM
jgi:hypothetical protein